MSQGFHPNPEISIVIPFFNEEGSLLKLYERLLTVLGGIHRSFEVIFVDDGSLDGSYEVVNRIAKNDPRVKVIRFRVNKGKAQALREGFIEAQGRIVLTMDADLQDDPEEIPNFLAKINEGCDLVSGWKKRRRDPLEKRIPSKLFNRVTSWITGLSLHDFNCGFKAYKHEILSDIPLYGDLHRYIPALAYWQGYTVGEIEVNHYPREHGISKYGWHRYFQGFFDLFTVTLLTKYIRNPAYVFGFAGLVFLLLGGSILAFITFLQLKYGSILGHRPLSYLAVLSILFGAQSISLGLLSEILTSISERARKGRAYIKKEFKHDSRKEKIDLSIIIPVHNERENLPVLYDALNSNLSKIGKSWEIIFVDDGSCDGSFDLLHAFHQKDGNVIFLELRRRYGKAAALQAGFDSSSGDVILTMDGDLQDSPDEIEKFLCQIDGGWDLVIGRRRKVPFLRSILSRIFNALVRFSSGVTIHDANCGFKAFKRPVLQDLRLYGELQRFFPVFVSRLGFKVREIEITHRERLYGKSKYGFARIPKAFLDLFSVVLLASYRGRPLHLFGSVGLLIGVLGVFINLYLTFLKVFTGGFGGHYTLMLFGVMFMVLGLQWFSTGLLGELIHRFGDGGIGPLCRQEFRG